MLSYQRMLLHRLADCFGFSSLSLIAKLLSFRKSEPTEFAYIHKPDLLPNFSAGNSVYLLLKSLDTEYDLFALMLV